MLASEEHTISPPIPIASPPRSRWVLTGLCLFALAALLLTSVRRPFWFDELFTFYIAGCALYLVLTTLSDRGFAFAEKRVGRSFRGGIGR